MKGDLGESFENLKRSMFIKYKGCMIAMEHTHYVWNGTTYYYLDSAKEAIDQALNMLQNSIPQNK